MVFPFCYEYVVRGRFERVAFHRKVRVTRGLVEDARRVTATLSLFNIKENAEIFWEWGHHTTRNVFIVVFLIVVFFLAVSAFIVIELGGVTFKSMIMFKSLRIDFSFVDQVRICFLYHFVHHIIFFSFSFFYSLPHLTTFFLTFIMTILSIDCRFFRITAPLTRLRLRFWFDRAGN